jgi:DNA-binding beta-propeller fold protein YncE
MKSFISKNIKLSLVIIGICLFFGESSSAQAPTPTTDRTASYSIGEGAEYAVFDGTYVWIANQFSNTVTKINSSNGTIIGNYATTGNPLGIDFDGRSIWISRYASNDVAKMDTATGIITATVKVNDGPGFLLARGGFIWVVNRLANTVQKISASDRPEVLTTYKVGKKPAMMAFDGTNLWVANSQSHSVSKINVTNDSISTYPVSGKGNQYLG